MERALLVAPGYVAVYADGGGAPGVRLGATALLTASEHRDLDVALASRLTKRGRVFVMLHKEDSGNRTFDFPSGDAPVQLAGSVLLATVDVDVVVP